MRYLPFGRTGLRVSELALGTGNFGTGWGHGAEKDEARRIFEAYVEAGGNFLDTADNYQLGQSETMLGEFLAGRRDEFVLATKYTLNTHPSMGTLRTGNSRKAMRSSVEASLKRLGTDHIDILWAHFPDGVTPLEEILRGFDDLIRAGKLLYGGLSNFPAWRVARADLLGELRGYTPLAGVQFEYSLIERSADREVLPMAESLGLGSAMWSPLGGGVLTGKYRQSDEGRAKALGVLVRNEKNERDTATVDAVLAVAQELDVAPAQVALAWVLQQNERFSAGRVPILGPRTLPHLTSALPAVDLRLSDAQLDLLSNASAISLGAPHEENARTLPATAGGQAERLKSRELVPA